MSYRPSSLFNHLMSKSMTPPEVGKGATILYHSDRDAYFVDEVSPDGKTVTLQKAKAIPQFKGMTDSQSYTYERNDRPHIYNMKIRFRYGSWYKMTETDSGVMYDGKIRIIFGVMNHYYDYSF